MAPPPPLELAAELSPVMALDEAADDAADEAAEDDAADEAAEVPAGLDVVCDVELLSVPQAARVMAPAANRAASAVNLVFFTRVGLSMVVNRFPRRQDAHRTRKHARQPR
jgi:hypothetical protein